MTCWRAACRFQLAFRGLPLRLRAGQRRFRLRHVGAGDFANPEAIVGRLQLLGQHDLIVAVQRELLLRLDHADVSIHRHR